MFPMVVIPPATAAREPLAKVVAPVVHGLAGARPGLGPGLGSGLGGYAARAHAGRG